MKTKKRRKARLYGKEHPRMPKPVSSKKDKGFSLRMIDEADSRFAVRHGRVWLFTGAIAFAPWIRHTRGRFTLRFLLIATALIASLLGLSVWVNHKRLSRNCEPLIATTLVAVVLGLAVYFTRQ